MSRSYGEVSETIDSGLILPTISVPSTVLKQNNLEILVGEVSQNTNMEDVKADAFLAPTISVRDNLHNSFVRYPVHKALVCGNGVEGILEYGAVALNMRKRNDDGSIFAAMELPHTSDNGNVRIAFVDLDAATVALDKFRESVENASDYERGWNRSGVPRVLDWLSRGGWADLKRLIESLLDAVEEDVRIREAKRIADREAHTVPDKARNALDRSVSAWAERAHKELRDSLDRAFRGRRWGGIAWWKLFWRVDDVGMVSAEILKSSYLRRAEKELIWMSGRLQQVGLFSSNNTNDNNPEQPPCWPTQVSASRHHLAKVNVPSLQAVAQKLVLHSISTVTLMSSISLLTYVSIPAASVYETSALAALSLIYSLRRQQKRWAPARTAWEDQVRESGRTSLRETEQDLREAIRQGGRPAEPERDIFADNIRKIGNARRALEEVK